MKEEALKLADELDDNVYYDTYYATQSIKKSSDMIRKLVAELDKQGEPVAWVNNMCNDSIEWNVDPLSLAEGTPLYTTPQTHQLNDEYVFICKRCGDELNIKYEEQKND